MPRTLGQTIRDGRSSKGWSQDELASRSGLSRNHVANVERGANVSVSVLEQLAGVLGISELPLGNAKLVAGGPKVNAAGVRRAIDEARSQLDRATRLLEPASERKRHGMSSVPKGHDEAAEPHGGVIERTPVRIYLVEDDREHEAWRKRLIDFASRSDQLAWREGRHTPAKYHSPLAGNVAAGHGAEIQPVDDEDLRQIPDYYWEKRGARFALRVYGQSLERRGIFEHDLVYVRPTEGEEPRNNAIVIAEVDTQIVCKIWRRVKGKPMLYSASPAFPKPIDPSRFGHFAVKGVVVGRSGDTQEAEAD